MYPFCEKYQCKERALTFEKVRVVWERDVSGQFNSKEISGCSQIRTVQKVTFQSLQR